MKKALISPLENNRIVEFSTEEFPVAEPLLWVDCPDAVTKKWSFENGNFYEPVLPSLDELKANAWEKIKAIRDKKIQNGGYKVAEKWFHSDTFSRTQQIGLVMLGINIPDGLQWKTMDGSFVLMTQALAQQIFSTAAQQDTAIFANAESHRAAINNMATSDEVSAYDITTGWPEVFA